jgi:hypothetical protein
MPVIFGALPQFGIAGQIIMLSRLTTRLADIEETFMCFTTGSKVGKG